MLLEGLIAETARRGKTDLSLVSVYSTTTRAHQDAAGMFVGEDVMEALEEAAAEHEQRLREKQALLGRSRGGLTSKIHLASDRKRRPLSFVLTAGQVADSLQFLPVLHKIRVRLPVGRRSQEDGQPRWQVHHAGLVQGFAHR